MPLIPEVPPSWPPGDWPGRPGCKKLPQRTELDVDTQIFEWNRDSAFLRKYGLGWLHPLASPLETSPRSGVGRSRFEGDPRVSPPPDASADLVADYVLPKRAGRKLQVFRCRECGVQIAHEADLCRRADVQLGWYAATFKRTMNTIVVERRSVCCLRCGRFLFPYDEALDPDRLTLPLYWRGEQVFDKTPVRAVFILDEKWDHSARVKDEPSRYFASTAFLETKLDEMCPEYEVEKTCFMFMRAGVKIPESALPPGEKSRTVRSREDYALAGIDLNATLQIHRQNGVRYFSFLFDFELDSMLSGLPTQDFSFYLNNRETRVLGWTDHSGARREEVFLRLWTLSGGNFVFADWTFVSQYKDYQGIPWDDEVFTDWPIRLETRDMFINLQPTWAALMRDGHFIGRWFRNIDNPELDSLHPKALEVIEAGLQSRHLFPRWLFLRDYPAFTFNQLRRHEHGAGNKPWLVPFAAIAKDTVVPNYRPDDPLADEEPKTGKLHRFAKRLTLGKKQCKVM